MSELDSEIEDGLRMIRYFWKEKGDIKRWCSWEDFKVILQKERPDLYLIITNYMVAEAALNSAVENI